MKYVLYPISIAFLLMLAGCGTGSGNQENEGDPGGLSDTVDIKTDDFTYSIDTMEFKGYLAWDANLEGPRPGILVIHEWWGHNAYARQRADMLAGLGYTAMALDMFGEGKTADHPQEAMAFVEEVMSTSGAAKQRFDKALEILKEHPTVNPDQIGVIGYCFGGGVALSMARAGYDLEGVVTFHGGLSTENPAEPGDIKAKLLICHGAADSFMPEDVVNGFKAEMDSANADYTFIAYENAKHSFTNPDADSLAQTLDMDIAYNRKADIESWQAMQDFFASVFEPED